MHLHLALGNAADRGLSLAWILAIFSNWFQLVDVLPRTNLSTPLLLSSIPPEDSNVRGAAVTHGSHTTFSHIFPSPTYSTIYLKSSFLSIVYGVPSKSF